MKSIVCDGRRQRFCQQCGRYHDLAAFDGDKRSCRARLQRHNARRRKKADTADSARVSSSLARLRGGRVAAKKGPREDETVDYARPASSRQKQAHGSCIKVRRCSACVPACLESVCKYWRVACSLRHEAQQAQGLRVCLGSAVCRARKFMTLLLGIGPAARHDVACSHLVFASGSCSLFVVAA